MAEVTEDPILRLVKKCDFCPEQYNVFNDTELVGFIYLRNGFMYVECPDSGGDVVYSAYPKGEGRFESQERDYYLRHAVFNILKWMKGMHPVRLEAPAVSYTIES
jgi:hypothetical protein